MDNTARDLSPNLLSANVSHSIAPSEAVALPSWRTLLRSPFASRYTQFYSRQSFALIKKERSALRHRLAANLMNLWPDQTSDLFNRCPWDQLIDILVNQCAYNHQIKSAPSFRHLRLKQDSRDTEPLTMTDWTAHRRGALASAHAAPGDDILVVEDPYLLSLALAQRGFERITVASRDGAHLKALAAAAEALGLKGRMAFAPLAADGGISQPVGRFKLAIIEAPADAQKAAAAIADAKALAAGGSPERLMMSIHLMGLLQPGLRELEGALSGAGLAIDSLHLGLNSFALPFWSAKRLQTLGRMATGMEILSLPRSRISYFVSDAMILRNTRGEMTS